jgi:predicted metal-binding membrane protein
MTMGVDLAREQRGLLALLLGLSAVAWYVMLGQSAMTGEDRMSLTLGIDAVLFLVIWTTMMVAMMFPAAAPMVLTYAHLQARRHPASGGRLATAAFMLGYLAVWSATGAVAYGLALGLDALAAGTEPMMAIVPRAAGAFILAAGVYQLTPLKRAYLKACRAPLGFLMTEWRDGTVGAFRVGLAHGAVCFGCCALLFAALVPLGMMNVALMALVASFVLVEKAFPRGDRIGALAAAALIACGALVIIVPAALPMGVAM